MYILGSKYLSQNNLKEIILYSLVIKYINNVKWCSLKNPKNQTLLNVYCSDVKLL